MSTRRHALRKRHVLFRSPAEKCQATALEIRPVLDHVDPVKAILVMEDEFALAGCLGHFGSGHL
jgi:hypothetical protein